jgi:hypothetical protein
MRVTWDSRILIFSHFVTDVFIENWKSEWSCVFSISKPEIEENINFLQTKQIMCLSSLGISGSEISEIFQNNTVFIDNICGISGYFKCTIKRRIRWSLNYIESLIMIISVNLQPNQAKLCQFDHIVALSTWTMSQQQTPWATLQLPRQGPRWIGSGTPEPHMRN